MGIWIRFSPGFGAVAFGGAGAALAERTPLCAAVSGTGRIRLFAGLPTAGIGAAVYAVIHRMADAGVFHFLIMILACVGLMSGLFVLLYGRNRHFRYFKDLTITLLLNGVRRLKADAR